MVSADQVGHLNGEPKKMCRRWNSVSLLIVCLCTTDYYTANMAFAQTHSTAKPSKDSMEIYLLIGQSNMCGRAPIEDQDKVPIDRAFVLNDGDEWEVATNPLNRFSTIEKEDMQRQPEIERLGPGYTFAKKMVAAHAGVQIGLVVNAKGGSEIALWKKGSRFYNEAVRRARAAQKSGTLKGILWHQGESDEKNVGYLVDLKQLIVDLRADLGDNQLPFVAGQINQVPLINDQIAKLPDALPMTAYVSSGELKATDRWHFDSASIRKLGERYFEAMEKLR